MALKIQAAFGAGELDPALHERTNLEKYQTGLATARNVYIGKTGRIISRPGTKYLKECYTTGAAATSRKWIWGVPGTFYFIELGHLYMRIHDVLSGVTTTGSNTLTETQLEYAQVVIQKNIVFIFHENALYQVIDFTVPATFNAANKLKQPAAPTVSFNAAGSGTGYSVRWAATIVLNGEESVISSTTTSRALPILPAEDNGGLFIEVPNTITLDTQVKVKVYRRPVDTLSFQDSGNHLGLGFVGYGRYLGIVGANHRFAFLDVGQDADYLHAPPSLSKDFYDDSTSSGSFDSYAKTGCFYQGKLVISGTEDRDAIFASRTNYWWNFTRDYPINSVSSLAFRCGTTSYASILRLMDLGGLVAFTTEGIYESQRGILNSTSIAMEKKGNWIIDEIVQPLVVPGVLLFVDKSSNSVVALNYSDNTISYEGSEISIFGSHLLKGKRIVSWDYIYGDTPIVWAALDDGTLVSLSYHKEHKLMAWTRHDTDGEVQSVTALRHRYDSVTETREPDRMIMVVKRSNGYFIEEIQDREVDDIKTYVGMDSSVIINGKFTTQTFTITADTPGDWDGTLTITASAAAFANTAGNGAVGTIFRFFDSDGFAIDLEVTTYTSTTVVKVTPGSTFPNTEATGVTELYKTYDTVTGLSHLNGKDVSVMVDGYIVGSPLNDVEDYDTYTVSGGSITLANGLRGAVIIVGLPYACDVETLDIDTVEQKPLLLESRLASRIHLKVHSSRGLFAGSSFPEDDLNTGMEDIEQRVLESDTDLLGNSAQQPYTRRIELTVPGDWKSNGRVCLRQVDPLPFEILSIIPDLEVYRR